MKIRFLNFLAIFSVLMILLTGCSNGPGEVIDGTATMEYEGVYIGDGRALLFHKENGNTVTTLAELSKSDGLEYNDKFNLKSASIATSLPPLVSVESLEKKDILDTAELTLDDFYLWGHYDDKFKLIQITDESTEKILEEAFPIGVSEIQTFANGMPKDSVLFVYGNNDRDWEFVNEATRNGYVAFRTLPAVTHQNTSEN